MPKPMPPMHQARYEGEWFRLWAGLDSWQLFKSDKTDPYVTLGGDAVLYSNWRHLEIALYADTAGLPDQHPSYKYYGGGLELRGYLFDKYSKMINPYASVGYGAYHAEIQERLHYGGTVAAPRFTLGLDFGPHYFLEGSYDAFGTHFGRDLGRGGVEVGLRF